MGKIKKAVREFLVRQKDREYRRSLEMKKGSYEAWIRKKEGKEEKNAGKTGELRDYVFLRHEGAEGLISEKIDCFCADFFARNPDVMLAYGDEDVIDPKSGERREPWFRPEWSPDLFCSSFYFGSIVIVRRELFDLAEGILGKDRKAEEYVRFCVEKCGGFEAGCRKIGHIPEVLFHNYDSNYCKKYMPKEEKTERYLESQTALYREIPGMVSVIIPSKDHPKLLKKCIEGILRTWKRQFPLQIVVTDNGSNDTNREMTYKLLEEAGQAGVLTEYLYRKEEFNFSRMCNRGADAAKGKYLLFLNDDVELCVRDTILKMAALAARPFTGAVGLKLYYPDSVTIQHIGVTNLEQAPIHKLQGFEDDRIYYYGMNRGLRNFIAVTGACVMIAKDRFLEAGGFSEDQQIAYNDVELCFRLCGMGYWNVCINDMYAFHHESFTRGYEETGEKRKRLACEKEKLYGKHPEFAGKDPFYPQGLERTLPEAALIRPEYEVAGKVQECSYFRRKKIGHYRQDACLFLKVSRMEEKRIYGYAVVLGDDNACYKRELLLKTEDGRVYSVRTKEKYRPDLADQLPDQVNVELCGFDIRFAKDLFRGRRFLLGMAAVNLTNSTRLCIWSDTTLTCFDE